MGEKEFYTLGNLGKMIDKRSHSQSISIDRARWETAWFVKTIPFAKTYVVGYNKR